MGQDRYHPSWRKEISTQPIWALCDINQSCSTSQTQHFPNTSDTHSSASSQHQTLRPTRTEFWRTFTVKPVNNRNGRNLGTKPSFQMQKLNIKDSIYHEMTFRYNKQCIKWSSRASVSAMEGSDKTVENWVSTSKLNVIIQRTVLLTHSSECCFKLVRPQEEWLLNSWGTSAPPCLQTWLSGRLRSLCFRLSDRGCPMRASRLIGCNSNAVQPPHINLTASPSQSLQRSGGNVILYCSSFAVYGHKYPFFSVLLWEPSQTTNLLLTMTLLNGVDEYHIVYTNLNQLSVNQ